MKSKGSRFVVPIIHKVADELMESSIHDSPMGRYHGPTFNRLEAIQAISILSGSPSLIFQHQGSHSIRQEMLLGPSHLGEVEGLPALEAGMRTVAQTAHVRPHELEAIVAKLESSQPHPVFEMESQHAGKPRDLPVSVAWEVAFVARWWARRHHK